MTKVVLKNAKNKERRTRVVTIQLIKCGIEHYFADVAPGVKKGAASRNAYRLKGRRGGGGD